MRIQRASVSRTLMELRLKLHGYLGIGKYLEVCQNFSARGVWGVHGPLMYIWDLHIISETTGTRKLKLKTQLHVVKY